MRKSKKHPPEPFDVGDFLRPTDTDLRSALTSLLHGQAIGPELFPVPVPAVNVEAGLRLVGVSMDSTESLALLSELHSPVDLGGNVNSISPLNMGDTFEGGELPRAGLNLTTPFISRPLPNPSGDTLTKKQSPSISIPPVSYTAPVNYLPALNFTPAPIKRQFAVRPAHLIEDGHSRAEQQVYAQLWENAEDFDDISRIITLGFASMGKLTGLSESNARINLRSLLQKLAIDEHTTYNCAASQGRTYRLYNPAEILRRRHAAGLSWVMRRTLAVVFVDPQTKLPLFPKTGSIATPGLNLSTPLILMQAVRGHLRQYGPADNPTVHALIDACQQIHPTLTPGQLANAIHQQALLTQGMSPTQIIDFLLRTVPQNL